MPEPLTGDEMKRLYRAFGKTPTGVRDRAFVSLLHGCGLRINECRMLDFDDLRQSDEGWSVRVRHPKGAGRGAPPREIGINASTLGMLTPWLKVRGNEPGPLFHTRNGKRMDASHFRRRLPQAAKSAGIARRVHPHSLRHTFARELNDEGINMRLIQLALGHANLNTTAIYLQSLGDPEVIAMTGGR